MEREGGWCLRHNVCPLFLTWQLSVVPPYLKKKIKKIGTRPEWFYDTRKRVIITWLSREVNKIRHHWQVSSLGAHAIIQYLMNHSRGIPMGGLLIAALFRNDWWFFFISLVCYKIDAPSPACSCQRSALPPVFWKGVRPYTCDRQLTRHTDTPS